MGSLSNYGENALAGHICGTAYSSVATVYLALCTADPTDAGTGASMNEVANSGSYARTAITFGAASSRRVTQSSGVAFPTATGSWGTVTHWAVVDTNTYGSGNMLAHGAFGSSFSVVTGNTRTVGASTPVYVEISSGGISNYAANGFLDRMFRNQAFTVSATYVALTTATIADTNTGSTITEPSGNNYSRTQINAAGGSSPAWAAASGGAVSNAHTVTLPVPSGSWGTVVAQAIVDASTSGNLLWYGNDVVDQAIGTETSSITFGVGALSLTVS